MAYNSLRWLDTISVLVNAADSTLYATDLIAMTVAKKNSALATLRTQSKPARQFHQLLQRPKTNKRDMT